jgi:hypothetical protein
LPGTKPSGHTGLVGAVVAIPIAVCLTAFVTEELPSAFALELVLAVLD